MTAPRCNCIHEEGQPHLAERAGSHHWSGCPLRAEREGVTAMTRLYAYLFPFRGQTGYRGRLEFWLWRNDSDYRAYWDRMIHPPGSTERLYGR